MPPWGAYKRIVASTIRFVGVALKLTMLRRCVNLEEPGSSVAEPDAVISLDAVPVLQSRQQGPSHAVPAQTTVAVLRFDSIPQLAH